MKFIACLFMLVSLAMASENDRAHRPTSFETNGIKAVFADFTEADYHITYDLTQKKATVKALIKFEMAEPGYPIFDSVSVPTSISLNRSLAASTEIKTPNNETTVRVLNQQVGVGKHSMEIEVPLTNLVQFDSNGVRSAFWTSDLTERRYLESYMPANFEFDQVKMTFFVKFIGTTNKQVIYTNGEMTQVEDQVTKISYPAYYNASSIFFHIVPEGVMNEVRFTLKSIDGREIPATVYAMKSSFTSNVEKMKAQVITVFQELESDYGAWLHPSIIVYQAGLGGMEYCGATMTELSAVGHEMFHSYFARGVMPANGNSGWIDEALASWRDNGHQSMSILNGTSGMSSHPYYTRITDRDAYSFGERFMRFLDNKVKVKGGLKPFMRHMIDNRKFSPLFVEEFMQEMSDFYGISVIEDFKKYTFGKRDFVIEGNNKKETHVHHKMSMEELQNYL